MSTRVLQGAEVKLAEVHIWRSAGNQAVAPASEQEPGATGDGEATAGPRAESGLEGGEPVGHATSTPPPPPAPPPPPPPEPTGPTWEEFRALEAGFRRLEAGLPEAEKRARADGRKEGEAAGLAAWKAAIENAARSVDQITSLRGRLRKEAEQDVVQLSLAIAKRVLRRELTIDPEAMLGLVRTAFERVEVREVHRVRVRPEDTAAISDFLVRMGGSQKIEVTADMGLDAGAVIVETARGNLDASLETQLAEIERGFTDLLTRRRKSDAA